MGQREWVRFFRMVGFVSDDDRPQPSEPLTVYRGTTWGRRRGVSWTENPEQAEWFASRWDTHGPGGLVFRVTVPPEAILALIGMKGGRNEAEVVVERCSRR